MLKMRRCWNCGAELGMIDDKNYDRMDTCGDPECEHELQSALRAEREEAHRILDNDMGYL
jgi:hypothetical protein